MPKMKTNKAVAKRVKITATGKVRVHRAGSGHLKSTKSPKAIRHLRQGFELKPAFARQAKKMIGK